MKRYPKILIAAPQNKVKDYAMEAWIENVRAFDYPKNRMGIFLADNSDTDEYAEELNKKYNINVIWNAPKGRSIFNRMAEGHNLCRDYALKHGYDFMFHLETDVFPEPDALLKLVFTRKHVISALYQLRGDSHRRHVMAQVMERHPNMNLAKTFTVFDDSCWLVDGTIKEVFHAGLGCILIHRSVLDSFMFRYDDAKELHPDVFFAQDMWALGYPVYLHTGIFCKHWNRNQWDKVILPFQPIPSSIVPMQ